VSTRVELSRPLAASGPAALGAMLAILEAAAAGTPPYDDATASLGLESLSVPVTVAPAPQEQRYECEVTIVAATTSGFFPRFDGSVSISPMRDEGSELWLIGSYTVPLGAVGEIVDATLLHGVATASLERFLTWLAEEIDRSTAGAIQNAPGRSPDAS